MTTHHRRDVIEPGHRADATDAENARIGAAVREALRVDGVDTTGRSAAYVFERFVHHIRGDEAIKAAVAQVHDKLDGGGSGSSARYIDPVYGEPQAAQPRTDSALKEPPADPRYPPIGQSDPSALPPWQRPTAVTRESTGVGSDPRPEPSGGRGAGQAPWQQPTSITRGRRFV